MTTKHTPGPWKFNEYGALIGADERPIRVEWTYVSSEEGHANARLIAAAPELLDELKLAPNPDHPQFLTHYRGWYEKHRANAIAKAEVRE